MKVCSTPITVTVRKEEEITPEHPEWLIAIADLLGITPEQAGIVVIGVASLIGSAILLSLLK